MFGIKHGTAIAVDDSGYVFTTRCMYDDNLHRGVCGRWIRDFGIWLGSGKFERDVISFLHRWPFHLHSDERNSYRVVIVS